ncbi:DNA repair protein RecO [Candidatus Saccharibacteria bacterium]|nr:DNA repair protein RecO [Candidatus Saccharibacteria bacterium]
MQKNIANKYVGECMLENMPKDLKTHAFVLKRTNYGEADRILNLITPEGKIAVMAKGVRKPKSKLAGGVEMFSLTEVNLHFGKTKMAVLTGAKMVRFYGEILKDLSRMEIASEILKRISRAADSVDSVDFFKIVDECLVALNDGRNIDVIKAWFTLNLTRVMGEEINLYCDNNGEKLKADKKYRWDYNEKVFYVSSNGEIDTNTIKILRLLTTTDLAVAWRIKGIEKYMPEILEILKSLT